MNNARLRAFARAVLNDASTAPQERWPTLSDAEAAEVGAYFGELVDELRAADVATLEFEARGRADFRNSIDMALIAHEVRIPHGTYQVAIRKVKKS